MKEKSVLNSFNSLRKTSQKIQIKSGIDILNYLFLKQKKFDKEEPCEELRLGVERLIRGLGAPRSDSRKGFYLAFVGLCNLFSSPTLSVEMCFNAIDKELAEFSSNAERNDVYKGQVLAYGGLIYSNKIFEANHEEIQKLLLQLIVIRSKKTYLSEAVHTFLIEYIKKVDKKTFKKSVWPIILPNIIMKDKETKSLQWYHLLSAINEKFPKYADEKLLVDLIGSSNVYDAGNLESIANFLLVITHTNAYIDSPMCQDILENIVAKKKRLKYFWQIVDTRLASATSSLMSHVFRLFISCCERLKNKNFIEYMLTPNFVTIFECESDTPDVEEIRQRVLEKLLKTIAEKDAIDSDTHLKIVWKLFFDSGNIVFLRERGFKIFLAVVNNFTEDNVKYVVKCFTDILCDNSLAKIGEVNPTKKSWNDNIKKIACNIIGKLLNHPKVISCVDWKIEQIKIIINLGFFSNKVSSTLAQAAKLCLYTGLDIKFLKLTDMYTYLNEIAIYLNDQMINNSSATINLSKEAKKCWEKMITVINNISTETATTDNEKLINCVFQILFIVLGLMIFKEPDSALDSLNELLNVYKHRRHELKSSTHKEIVKDKQEPYWTDVLVELILSLLSNNSRLLRGVIAKIFVVLCPQLSTQNIDQILNVLNPNVDVLSNTETAKAKDDSVINEDDSSMDNDDDEEESVADEDSDELDDKDLDKLRATTLEALGDNDTMTDNESVDLDDLDKEQGNRIDESLSEAFKQLKQHKLKTKSVENRLLSDFRTRVVDLLDIWVKSEPALNTIFEVMVTILMLLEKSLQTGTDVQLQNRLKTLLKKLTSVKNFTIDEKINVGELSELMKKLINKEEKSAAVYVNMSQQIIDCCTFILKLSMRDLKKVKKLRPIVLEAYREALKDFFNKPHSLIPVGLFQSALDLCWAGSFVVVKDISDYTFAPDVSPFRIKHGLNLLQTFLRNKRLFTADFCSEYSDDLRHIASKLLDNTSVFQNKQNQLYIQYVNICQHIANIDKVQQVIDANDIDKLKKLTCKKRKLDEQKPVGESKKLKVLDEDCDVKMKTVEGNDNNVKAKKTYTKREKDRYKVALKTKKKRKYTRSEGMSQGLEGGMFGSFLFENSEYMNGGMEQVDNTDD